MNTNKTNNQNIQKKIYTNTTTLNHLQELPTNMNTQFCVDMIKEHGLPCENPSNPAFGEDYVFVTESGHVYRKKKIIDGIEKRYVWTILHNNNGACGWYRTDSPALFSYRCDFMDCSGIQMSDGTYADFCPEPNNTRAYHIKDLRYCLTSPMPQEQIQSQWRGQSMLQVDNSGKEEIYLYICAKKYGGDMLLGSMYPMIHLSPVFSGWTPSSEIKQQNILDGWMNSKELSCLPFYEPMYGERLPVFWGGGVKKETNSFDAALPPPPPLTDPVDNYCDPLSYLSEEPQINDWRGLFDWHGGALPPMSWDTEPLTPWGEDELFPENVQEKVVDQEQEEGQDDYRYDPTADDWFTKVGFVEYYGDEIMWNMCSPEKNSRRWMIECLIDRSQDTLSSKEINHLLDKIVETFV